MNDQETVKSDESGKGKVAEKEKMQQKTYEDSRNRHSRSTYAFIVLRQFSQTYRYRVMTESF